MSEKVKQPTPKFPQRFNVKVEADEVRNRFINRAINMIHGAIIELETKTVDEHKKGFVKLALVRVATELGVAYRWDKLFSDYAKTDFSKLPCIS